MWARQMKNLELRGHCIVVASAAKSTNDLQVFAHSCIFFPTMPGSYSSLNHQLISCGLIWYFASDLSDYRGQRELAQQSAVHCWGSYRGKLNHAGGVATLCQTRHRYCNHGGACKVHSDWTKLVKVNYEDANLLMHVKTNLCWLREQWFIKKELLK